MTCLVIGTDNAKVESALDVLAVRTAIANTGGKLKQTDVPTSLATMVMTNARVI